MTWSKDLMHTLRNNHGSGPLVCSAPSFSEGGYITGRESPKVGRKIDETSGKCCQGVAQGTGAQNAAVPQKAPEPHAPRRTSKGRTGCSFGLAVIKVEDSSATIIEQRQVHMCSRLQTWTWVFMTHFGEWAMWSACTNSL